MQAIPSLLICSLIFINGASALTLGNTNVANVKIDQASYIGNTTLKNSSFNSLSVVGQTSFDNVKVKSNATIVGDISNSQSGTFGTLNVTGNITASNVECQNMLSVGVVKVNQLVVSKKAEIVGPLSASKSEFNELVVTNKNTQLDDSTVQNLHVRENKAHPKEQQTLYLTGTTVISGDVSFENENGLVKKAPSAEIKGQVKGGKVEKLESKA